MGTNATNPFIGLRLWGQIYVIGPNLRILVMGTNPFIGLRQIYVIGPNFKFGPMVTLGHWLWPISSFFSPTEKYDSRLFFCVLSRNDTEILNKPGLVREKKCLLFL